MSFTRLSLRIATLVAITTTGGPVQAELQGAKNILPLIPGRNRYTPVLEERLIQHRIQAYKLQEPELSPEAAAKEWLHLLDSVLALRHGGFIPYEVATALPRPEAWPSLARAFRERAIAKPGEAFAWRFFANTLEGDRKKQIQLIKQWSISSKDARYSGLDFEWLRLLEREQLPIDEVAYRIAKKLSNGNDPLLPSKWVPDLVGQMGTVRAKVAIRTLLSQSFLDLDFHGPRTIALAKEISLRNTASLKRPQWSLITSLDDVPLYEALRKHFPKSKVEDSARIHAFLGYIDRQRGSRALALAQEAEFSGLSDVRDDLRILKKRGRLKRAADTLFRLVQRNRLTAYWNVIFALNAPYGRTSQLADALIAKSQRDVFGGQISVPLELQICRTLVAAGRVPQAVQRVRNLISSGDLGPFGVYELPVYLMGLGKQLGRSDLIREGKDAVWRTSMGSGSPPDPTVIFEIERVGFPEDAERLAINSLQSWRKSEGPYDEEVAEIVGLYHRAGRSADVLALIDESQGWWGNDLAEMAFLSDGGGTPLNLMVASALIAKGDNARAVPILQALLKERPSANEAYSLLVDAEGDNAIPFFRALLRADPMESRPLVGIAYAHRVAGRLPEAETAAREAISKCRFEFDFFEAKRKFHFEELVRILRGEGKAEALTEAESNLQALRLAEKSNELLKFGFVDRGLDAGRTAVVKFPKDPQLQFELALRLREFGRDDEAERFERIGNELIASSPNGLERFEDEASRGTVRSSSAKLMGARQLYQKGQALVSAGDVISGRIFLWQAVAKNSNLFDAWVGIYKAAELPPASRKDRQVSLGSLLKLDPLIRSFAFEADSLAERWRRTDSAIADLPRTPFTLYPIQEAYRSPYVDSSFHFKKRMDWVLRQNRIPNTPSEVLIPGDSLVAAIQLLRSAKNSQNRVSTPGE